jgi:hypothetical protein
MKILYIFNDKICRLAFLKRGMSGYDTAMPPSTNEKAKPVTTVLYRRHVSIAKLK